MPNNSITSVLKNRILFLPMTVFVLLALWWLYIRSLPLADTDAVRQLWAALYQVMAILGGVIGLYSLKKWGGVRSLLGKAVLAFSVGLFLQSFGQSVYSYYIFYQHVDVPYPSLGDVGFFGSVLAYIYAVSILGKVLGADFSFKLTASKVRSIAISLFILIASYLFFLRSYEFDWSAPLRVLLDFGYPLGQAVYLSIAIASFLVAREVLGGVLKRPILFLIFALVFQYVSDFMFLYQYSSGTWYVGGINDFMYFVSYFLMTIALVYIDGVFSKIQKDVLSESTPENEFKNNMVEGTPHAVLMKVILAIIRKQEKVAGAIAWEEAKKVPGLKIIDERDGKMVASGDAGEVVDSLVSRYKGLFGDLAVEVSKDASKHLLSQLKKGDIPKSLI